jgi:hypothetical protein
VRGTSITRYYQPAAASNGVGPFSVSEKFDRFFDRFPAEVSVFSIL